MPPVELELPSQLLLISSSASAMARSASRAGMETIALDFYADVDTLEAAHAVSAVKTGRYGFDSDDLLAKASRLAPPKDFPLVYGSGLDSSPELLEKLSENRLILGNQPHVLRAVRNTRNFFSILDQLEIPYPDTRWSPPVDNRPKKWLIKRGLSEGGKGIRWLDQDIQDNDVYYQKKLPGHAHSLLFLAGSGSIAPIGFNRLHHISTPTHPFLFAGATEAKSLDNHLKAKITSYAKKISQTLSLRGLNSLDFLIHDNACFILELNCRPSATLALYDEDFMGGILAAHIRASCYGALESPRERDNIKGFKVVIAEQTLEIPSGFAWPAGCFDRPKDQSILSKGDPLCTVEAQGASETECHRQLDRKEQMLLNQLLTGI